MGKHVIFLMVLWISLGVFAQNEEAYKFKLDYDVPESPAFAVLDANPTTVMRGSAAKELVVNLANNFISNAAQETGVAIDFNPYFVFGGRLQNIEEYRESPIKRLLANAQISFASIASDEFPDDNLISVGLRITLFDSFDLLKDTQLGEDISAALSKMDDPSPPGVTEEQYKLVKLQGLKDAYDKAKERLKNKKGGAFSIGAALAQRARGGILSADSLATYRNQAWMSGQYSFGNGTNLLGLAMYRNTKLIDDSNVDEVLLGLGLRHLGNAVNIGGEVVYASEKKYIEINGNIETRLFDNVLLAISIGNGSEDGMNENNRLLVKPTLKYNLSQSRK